MEDLIEKISRLESRLTEVEAENSSLRKSQEELELSLFKYVNLKATFPVAYLTLNKRGFILETNTAAAELLQVSESELMGTNIDRFFKGESLDRFFEHVEKCAFTGQLARVELYVQTRNRASPVAVQLSSRPAAATDKPELLIHTVVSEVREITQAAQDLDQMHRDQERICYAMSHELRTPLLTIMNFCSLIEGNLEKNLLAESIQLAGRARRAATRLDERLRNIIDYCMFTRAELEVVAVDLDVVVDELLRDYRMLVLNSGATIIIESSLGKVIASHDAIRQCVGNMLTNAIKFTPAGKAPLVEISSEKTAETIVLKIRDYGIGIDPQFHDRIFGLFERLHSDSSYPGHGFGLAIVRRIAERLNGRVYVASALGQGSAFFLELPRSSENRPVDILGESDISKTESTGPAILELNADVFRRSSGGTGTSRE